MVALSLWAGGLALAAATPTAVSPIDRWRPLIAEASSRFGIPERWIERVIRAESGGRTAINGQPVRSRAGAIGLMQLMPPTWDAMRLRFHLGLNPDDPRDNILAGTGYLRWLSNRFGYPGLFAAYNAGPARYAQHLTTGRALPGETKAYLSQVGEQSDLAATPARVAQDRLFAIKLIGDPSAKAPSPTPVAGLFAVKQ